MTSQFVAGVADPGVSLLDRTAYPKAAEEPYGREPALLVEVSVVERAQQGDAAAFARLVDAYRRRVFGTIGRLINRFEDTEDVAQEVFLRLHQSLRALREPRLFEPWLYRIIINAARDYLRRRRRSGEIRFADMDEEQADTAMRQAATDNGKEEEQLRQIRHDVERILSCISPGDRVLLVLKEIEGMSLEDLSRIYGVPTTVLKSRLFRARQRTLRALAETEGLARA